MRTFWSLVLTGALLLGVAESRTAEIPDLILADFESEDYGAWESTGTCFTDGPARGGQLATLEIEGALGHGVASSELQGDGPKGTLTSPEFKLERGYLAFRIAGGDYEHHTCLNLLVDGEVVRSATGWRSDRLAPASWDVSRWRGQYGRVQIVDQASGDWGHLNVDHIVQTDHPERPPVEVGTLYRESLRPQFHFTARQWTMDRLNPGMRQEGWLNDLNGLIYYEGKYHLFAQRWNKCWIHAVSSDLVRWEELQPAFWEEELDSGVQSGTCVVDYGNTSGLAPDNGRPALVAFWSRNDNRSQCLSYSLDRGRTWKPFEGNPILVHRERDPKVFWHAPTRRWVMLLYGDAQYHVLTSSNLLAWKDEHQHIRDSFECPDFFELPLDGRKGDERWVLIQGNGHYSVGRFDGTRYEEETARRPCDVGANFYATQTWANNDTGDGRRIQAAWMRSPGYPEMPFNQAVTFPCELSLRTTPKGLRLFREPVRELESLHLGEDRWTNRTLQPGEVLPLEPSGREFHIRAALRIPMGATLTFIVRGVPVILTAQAVEPNSAPAQVADRVREVEILVDRTSVETFVNRGEISCTRFILPHENGLLVRADGAPVVLESLSVFPLKSIWAAPSAASGPPVLHPPK